MTFTNLVLDRPPEFNMNLGKAWEKAFGLTSAGQLKFWQSRAIALRKQKEE